MDNSRTASDALCLDADGGLARLLEIMARLRDPETGCSWDIDQDFASIAPYTIEEAYEVADAIERKDWRDLEGELGDLLLQVVYHARMGEEAGHFDFDSITEATSNKMVARHPHVFGTESREKSARQQVRDWERIKAAERAAAGRTRTRTLDGVARGLPALMRAVKLQKRAARVGFDWPTSGEVLKKVVEEAYELDAARAQQSLAEVHEEFGDLLFVMANLARHFDVDPEVALRDANEKFIRRFNALEDKLETSGRSLKDADLAEMDTLWNAVKRDETLPD